MAYFLTGNLSMGKWIMFTGKIVFPAVFFAITCAFAAERALESYTYQECFQRGDLAAWYSYPHMQDTAFDPTLYCGEFPGTTDVWPVSRPGVDSLNYSAIRKLKPNSRGECTFGLAKRLEITLDEKSTILWRFYIKSYSPVEHLTLTLFVSEGSKLNYRIEDPIKNSWESTVLSMTEIIEQNSITNSAKKFPLQALSLTIFIPEADPDAYIYFAVDDIKISGYKQTEFNFSEPPVTRLSEWPVFIPEHHYHTGDTLIIKGSFGDLNIKEMTCSFSSFAEPDSIHYSTSFRYNKKTGLWELRPVEISGNTIDKGFWIASITGYRKKKIVAESRMTIIVAPDSLGGEHPRLMFGAEDISDIKKRTENPPYAPILENILSRAERSRNELNPDNLVYNLHILDRIRNRPANLSVLRSIRRAASAVKYNALEYAVMGSKEAGN